MSTASDQPLQKSSYTIQISQHQQQLMLRLMKAGLDILKETLNTEDGEWGDTNLGDAENLIDMSQELPNIPDTHNAIHGFAL